MKKILTGLNLIIIGLILIIIGYYYQDSKRSEEYVEAYKMVKNIKFDSITVNDFVGKVEIIKSNENKIVYDGKIEIENKDNELEIRGVKVYRTFYKNQPHVKIYYKDIYDIEIDDSVGKFDIELDGVKKLEITDSVGKFTVNTDCEYEIIKSDTIGKVKRNSDIIDRSQIVGVIEVTDMVGKVEINKRK